MLKNIDPLLNGTLLALLDDMGHGNEIAITDANFGADAVAERLVDLPGTSASDLLTAILTVFPLDDFVDKPLAVMKAPPETDAMYAEFQASADAAEGRAIGIDVIEPGEFVARAKLAYAVISSGERRLYGNIILRKGVLRP
ncbi:RbsD/FucU family protein [Aureimonas sp. AU12]|uniref:RbsD/FucU family protein n=1 Tax=Aureimonas sp. AU12 TaxID=1638161 RepID=UPI000781D333|nr:RbsD/FucU domain-containing protein [Aureimonas sp. AU12]